MKQIVIVSIIAACVGFWGGYLQEKSYLHTQSIQAEANAVCDWTRSGYRATKVRESKGSLYAICVGKGDSLNPTIPVQIQE